MVLFISNYYSPLSIFISLKACTFTHILRLIVTSTMSYTKFINGHLCDNGIIYYDTELFIDNKSGKIISEIPQDVSKSSIKLVDLQGNILAPGFIDIQNNGIYGLNFSSLNEHSTPSDITNFKNFYKDAMFKYLATGVTSICPTVTSSFPQVYEKVLPVYEKSRLTNQCDSLGAHVEGPFINLNKKGCHPPETLVDAKEGESQLNKLYGESNLLNYVTILTAAPEIPGITDLIPIITSKDITFSIGHTTSTYADGLRALDKGATMITHLYNAMPQPHHRDVGVVGLITTPISRETPYFGLISDGVHVDPSMIVLAYRSNPDKCILVTDAMHLIGLPDGTYKWDSQSITKTGPILYLKGTKTLAGAATTLPQCVRNLVKWSGIPLAKAIKTVTNNAANSIGAQHEKGFLNPGCDADLVILNDEGFVKSIYKLGHMVRPVDEDAPGKLIASL